MKRIVKRILPILLCLIILVSIAWYFFSYDRAFTRDILLSSARFFESHGNHEFATWLYNQAYYNCGGDDAVIIELADRFKANGNYTKAEVTLSKAIAEGGSVELYVALCKTYVEQDKLLDAANMLANVTDPEIKAQLDAMRPAAPAVSPAPGFYTQYITVSFQNTSGQLYVSYDKDFPSTEADLYTEGVQLSAGESGIYAIAVGENGLVSESVYFAFTVGGVVEEVTVSDPALDLALREILGVSSDTQLMTSDLWKITELNVPADAQDLSDLALLPFLQTLTIENVNVPSLQALSSLTQLKQLTVRDCTLSRSDLTVIAGLPILEDLVLSDCSLSNIEPLSNAVQLVTLDLSKNAINDISALSFMTELTKLDLSNNALTNLSFLSALTSLQKLDVSYNSLVSIAPLVTCTALTELNASNNQIAHLIAFPNTALSHLDVSNNQLADVSVLEQFSTLTELNVSKNLLTDISALSSLNNLVILRFAYNEVTTLPQWDTTCSLSAIDGSYNKITSVAPLKGLTRLNLVSLDFNKVSNVNPLADCTNLIQVDVYGNPVRDVSKLTNLGIIVNYTPQ